MKKSILALATGTFGLGMAEFSMMGILTDIANSLHVTIPQAGHLIAAYALGVAVGAPIIVLIARNLAPKKTLLILAVIFLLGNFFFAISNNYYMCLLFRFIAGFPHGAYFGVASIAAQRIAKPGKEASAIAGMVAGMTVANLVGVPLGTFLAHQFDWHVTYFLIAAISVVIFTAIYFWVPKLDPLPNVGIKGQFLFLTKLAPWLIIIATVMGNGGIFAYFSYIKPLMTKYTGFLEIDMTGIMVLAGLGMVIGNILGGLFSDKFKPNYVGTVTQAIAAVLLVGVFFYSDIKWASLFLMFLITACLFAVSAPQQLLILKNAHGGDMLAGACIQIAFNVGNAIGATLGGIPIAMGKTENFVAIPGVALAILGTFAFVWYNKHVRKKNNSVLI